MTVFRNRGTETSDVVLMATNLKLQLKTSTTVQQQVHYGLNVKITAKLSLEVSAASLGVCVTDP